MIFSHRRYLNFAIETLQEYNEDYKIHRARDNSLYYFLWGETFASIVQDSCVHIIPVKKMFINKQQVDEEPVIIQKGKIT